MIKSVKYTQGNEMTLYIPLILLGNEGRQTIDIDLITDANVSISRNGVKTVIEPVFVDGYMTLNLAATLAAGAYAIEYSFKYDGRKVAGRKDGSLAIVADDAQSNWSGMISNGTATLDEVFIAGNVMTDAEFEALKEEYRLKTAAAEAARIAYVAAKASADAVAYTAVEGLSEEALTEIITNAVNEAMSQASVSVDLTPVTSRLDNTTYGLNALKTAIDGIEVDVPADVARETTPKAIENAALAAKAAAEAISIPTDYAKETTAEAARVAAVAAKSAAEGISIPTDYAKASAVTSQDAESNPMSVGAAVSSVAHALGVDADAEPVHSKLDQLRQECDKIGSPASGQPSTLFAAIAAGGSGGGSDPEVKEMLQKIINASFLSGVSYVEGCTFNSGVDIPTGFGSLIYKLSSIKAIEDDSLESATSLTCFKPLTSCKYYTFNELVELNGSFLVSKDNVGLINEISMPKLNAFRCYYAFYQQTSLMKVNIPNAVFTAPTEMFTGCNSLIDLVCGVNWNSSVSLSTWNPTIALNSTTSLLSAEDINNGFETNLEKLLYNIREHIAANLPTITSGYSITFSSAVKAAILADTETTAAFTNKGWTIA